MTSAMKIGILSAIFSIVCSLGSAALADTARFNCQARGGAVNPFVLELGSSVSVNGQRLKPTKMDFGSMTFYTAGSLPGQMLEVLISAAPDSQGRAEVVGYSAVTNFRGYILFQADCVLSFQH